MLSKKNLVLTFFLFSPILLATLRSQAPSALEIGPNTPVASSDYRLEPEIDPKVLPDRKTEVWGKIFWPNFSGQSNYPLIVFLHGNHATCGKGENPRFDTNCEYTNSGTCPTGFTVVPNHAGYDYVANHLASHGFIVASINANRGITCGGSAPGDSGLNLARGRLVLKHLSLLYQWGKNGGGPGSIAQIASRIRWSSVGLVGHSRGGEGMRAAWYYINNPDAPPGIITPKEIQVKGIYEIGAVDGQTSLTLDAPGLVWNQLLPMCDGDVSDLQGRYPYDRMMKNKNEPPSAQKSLLFAWGSNHNFFNTQWQTSDSDGCTNHKPIFPPNMGSEGQQLLATQSITSFFLALLTQDQIFYKYNQNTNPLYDPPEAVLKTTRVERDFVVSPSEKTTLPFERFDQATGTNTYGSANQAGNVDVSHININRFQRAGLLGWNKAGGNTFFQTNWTPEGSGRDVHLAKTLDIRVARFLTSDDPSQPIDFSVQLVDAKEARSTAIKISDFIEILGPGNAETTFQTARIPVEQFQGVDPSQIRGIRFVFDKTGSHKIYLSDLQFSNKLGIGSDQNQNPLLENTNRRQGIFKKLASRQKTRIIPQVQNAFLGLRKTNRDQQRSVEIVIGTKQIFPVMNQLPVLQIGKQEFKSSRYLEDGKLNRMAFLVPTQMLSRFTDGERMILRYGTAKNPSAVFLVGLFDSKKQIE